MITNSKSYLIFISLFADFIIVSVVSSALFFRVIYNCYSKRSLSFVSLLKVGWREDHFWLSNWSSGIPITIISSLTDLAPILAPVVMLHQQSEVVKQVGWKLTILVGCNPVLPALIYIFLARYVIPMRMIKYVQGSGINIVYLVLIALLPRIVWRM